MKGLKIDMSQENGPVFELESKVEGANTTVQNALINIATTLGADPIFPERGTQLLAQALQGRLVNLQAAQVASNFAAIDTTFFLAETEISTSPSERIQRIGLSPIVFTLNNLQINAEFDMEDGTTIGADATL